MTNSRQKGSRGERTVLKILKTHFGDSPWERKSLGIPGPDLLTPQSFPWCVEVKNVKTVKVKHLVFHPTKELLAYWDQAKQQAASFLTKQPLLCINAEQCWYAVTKHMESSCVANWDGDVVSVLPLTEFCVRASKCSGVAQLVER